MATGEKVKKIQIHKNCFKKYYDMRWLDVPEFILFETVPEGWIQVWEDKPEKPNLERDIKRAKMERGDGEVR